jgi:hypothetical protein
MKQYAPLRLSGTERCARTRKRASFSTAALDRLVRERVRLILGFQGHQSSPRITSPDDPLEREADATAAHVMGAPSVAGPAGGAVHSQNRSSEKQNTENAHEACEVPALGGTGSPLPQSEREFFEPRMNADFSSVRVHTDAKAAEVAESLHARAFAVGHEIAFASGQYEPRNESGRRLLAHELCHVRTLAAGEPTVCRAMPSSKVLDFEMGEDGSILVKKDDWLSKYTSLFLSNYEEYRGVGLDGTLVTIGDPDRIYEGEVIYHVPTLMKYMEKLLSGQDECSQAPFNPGVPRLGLIKRLPGSEPDSDSAPRTGSSFAHYPPMPGLPKRHLRLGPISGDPRCKEAPPQMLGRLPSTPFSLNLHLDQGLQDVFGAQAPSIDPLLDRRLEEPWKSPDLVPEELKEVPTANERAIDAVQEPILRRMLMNSGSTQHPGTVLLLLKLGYLKWLFPDLVPLLRPFDF